MNKKLGFIGCGNMAKAMIGGILSSRVIENTQIIASAKSDKTISQVSQQFGILLREKLLKDLNITLASQLKLLEQCRIPRLWFVKV